jgi:hypothetical protein
MSIVHNVCSIEALDLFASHLNSECRCYLLFSKETRLQQDHDIGRAIQPS